VQDIPGQLAAITPEVALALLAGVIFGGLLVLGSVRAAGLRREAAHAAEIARIEAAANAEAAALTARLESAREHQDRLLEDVRRRDARIEALSDELGGLRVEHARLGARHEEISRAAEEKLRLLNEAREQLGTEFSNLANRIFQEKTDRFARESSETLGLTLGPLREQLADFRRRVDEVYTGDVEGRVKLLHEIGALKELNRQMSDEALNLTRALKGDSKVQGGWGEVVLERVLEESGLRKGHEYETQVAFRDEGGQRRMPDVVLHLPEGKDVVIDSKVSLLDYERYCSAATEEERKEALKAHIASLRNHIESLSLKDYEGLEGLRTLDFVLVFMPIEAAFMKALEVEPSLFSRAYERNVIVVSPTTLLATLRTIQSIWRYERQNRNAEEIARRAGALHDQFVRVLESLEELGRLLGRARDAYDQTLERLSRGRGNLVGRVVALEKLGAKVRKRIPESVIAVAELDEESLDEYLPPEETGEADEVDAREGLNRPDDPEPSDQA